MKNRHRSLLTVLMVTTGFLIGAAVGQANCPNEENYQPCTCYLYSDGEYSVECFGVLVEDVVSIFKRTTPSRLKTFEVSLSAFNTSADLNIITIPANWLNEHEVHRSIHIQLYNATQIYSLRIEPEALSLSRNFTEEFYLEDWDLSQLDFDFLTGFDNLTYLALTSISNVHLAKWTSLPRLPNLRALAILRSTGLNEWEAFPSLATGLEFLFLDNNQIQNVAMDRILNWTVGHSASILEALSLDGNNLTSIPLQIPTFTSLRDLSIYSQKTGISLISSGSINLSGPKSRLTLSSNRLETVEPGAFQGNFVDAIVYISSNNLTRFEELVFKEMLQQMTSPSSSVARLYAHGNPFDCESDPCLLAWIIKDNRVLLTPLEAYCSNGTYFKDLNANAFSRCGITTSFSNVTTPTTTKPSSNSSVRPNSHHHITRVLLIFTSIFMLILNNGKIL